jgi:hypothetical protein
MKRSARFELSRRGLMMLTPGAGLALSGCAGGALLAPAARGPTQPAQGLPIASTSVQISANTLDAETGFVVRLARYPSIGVAWVWAHFFEPGQVWSYSDDALSTERVPSPLEQPDITYRQTDGANLEYRRAGPRPAPTRVDFTGVFAAHRSARVEHGRGNTPVRLQATLVPFTARPGVLPDRTEAKGMVDAVMELGGRRIPLRGYGHFHEQPQEQARFTDAFAQMRGSGEGLALTFQMSRTGGRGHLTIDGKPDPIRSFQISEPARMRRYRASFASGRTVEGEVTAPHTFYLKIYDGWRTSQMIRGMLDGRPFVGGVNDWNPEQLTYLPA